MKQKLGALFIVAPFLVILGLTASRSGWINFGWSLLLTALIAIPILIGVRWMKDNKKKD